MPTVYDVYPNDLIQAVAKKLRENYTNIKAPELSIFWKTASFKEIAPIDHENFWYIRCASILRKIYLQKVVGVNRLRKQFGGRDKNHYHAKHAQKGSGAIIRRCIHQLDTAGLTKNVEGKGRILTPAGISLLDKTATEIYKQNPIERFAHLSVMEDKTQ